ncbi:PTS sugar transporter subunit IIC [Clostridium sardiniense]|uniref:Permease IIC component n=1 Tax=Clostridium sardiniense TaxID=29369 RepID=A0ABS7KV34_CLOSR|nr:PTS sugar transporter subunit IIC [Clostridium sardiniense]MBY0754442.1 PTS sugar transporter subunit IIC [Clostridium sardiniense]MDQ0461319.1 PTS system cellobiose-specific IIC component [Clostridium sardiniense]
MGHVEKVFNKMMPAFMKFANSKVVSALKDGFVLTMPLTLIGSVFMLIGNFPISNWNGIMESIFGAGWAAPLNQVTGATFDIIALVGVFGIAYSYAKSYDIDAVPSGILGIISFLIVSNSFVVSESGEVINGVIPKAWTAGQGMITAILVGLAVGAIYSLCIRKNLRIKMPESVPPGVSNAFSALIPGFIIATLSMIVYIVCDKLKGISMTEIIYEILQIPMQNLSDSLVGIVVIMALISIFWWFGLHGPNIVMGIMAPILTANSLGNQAVVDAGQSLVVGENAKVVTVQMVDIYAKFGGAGITLGLIIAALIVAKSRQVKELSKMALVPGIFNINEPVIFGLPIVFNPLMIIPFILVPIFAVLMTYFSITLGFIEPFLAVQVPWTTPSIISGFLLSGWQGAVLQIAILAMSVFMYLPFVKLQDKVSYNEENKVNGATN